MPKITRDSSFNLLYILVPKLAMRKLAPKQSTVPKKCMKKRFEFWILSHEGVERTTKNGKK